MTGFANVEDGIKHFFANLEGAHPALKDALTFLQNSAATLAKEIEAVGLPALKTAATAIATEAAGALNGTIDKSTAGKAAIAAGKAAVKEVSDDALHILATDLLNTTQALVG